MTCYSAATIEIDTEALPFRQAANAHKTQKPERAFTQQQQPENQALNEIRALQAKQQQLQQ